MNAVKAAHDGDVPHLIGQVASQVWAPRLLVTLATAGKARRCRTKLRLVAPVINPADVTPPSFGRVGKAWTAAEACPRPAPCFVFCFPSASVTQEG